MIKLSKVYPAGTTLEMRLTFGGSFMMFPPVIKMGFYSSWIQDVSDSDQEFIVFLLEKDMVEKKPGVHETIGRCGSFIRPL